MPLKDVQIRNAKPRAKAYKLYDGSGLFVLVHPNGSRYWRLKYHYADKEKVLALGVYTKLTAVVARASAEEARTLVKKGKDPITHKHVEKAHIFARALYTFKTKKTKKQTKHTNQKTTNKTNQRSKLGG